jgi:hypothetical protein
MPRTTGPQRKQMLIEEGRPPIIVDVLTMLLLGVLAYVAAVFLYFVLTALVAAVPGENIVTPEIRTALFYVLFVVTVIVLSVPMLTGEGGLAPRFLLGAATFLVLFVISEATKLHFLSPYAMLDYFHGHVLGPLQRATHWGG